MQQVPDIIEILLPDGFIQTQFDHYFSVSFRRHITFAGKRGYRISRQQSNKAEGHYCDPEKYGHQQGDSFEYEGKQLFFLIKIGARFYPHADTTDEVSNYLTANLHT